MPIAFLMISLIIASTLSLTMVSVSRDLTVGSELLQSSAALLAAESGVMGTLELNQGIDVASITTTKKASDLSFDAYERSSGEVLLTDVSPEESVDFIRLEYCLRGASCPELLIEWFELEKDFQFQSLEKLREEGDEHVVVKNCLDFPELGIKRCAARTSLLASHALSLKPASAESPYQFVLRFQTLFSTGKSYLFHFLTIDANPITFEFSGERFGKRASLPGQFSEQDSMGHVNTSFRRIRHRTEVTGGLQDRLWFAHSAEELADK